MQLQNANAMLRDFCIFKWTTNSVASKQRHIRGCNLDSNFISLQIPKHFFWKCCVSDGCGVEYHPISILHALQRSGSISYHLVENNYSKVSGGPVVKTGVSASAGL